MKRVFFSLMASPLLVAATLQSAPGLGTVEGRCRSNELGPSFIVNVAGLKDRTGKLKLEVYPAKESDFLEDDNVLISAGKTFRRVEQSVPASGPRPGQQPEVQLARRWNRICGQSQARMEQTCCFRCERDSALRPDTDRDRDELSARPRHAPHPVIGDCR
jgi:hypothetical protein